ncbi:hypothetical protein TNIN_90941 [Trichonephila inaurata madagascariensis]|uniref:Uncharacterized protein n=1 Tax=Trichonephila inaurata madagascariensis TaxID=2747483 RepID=A0A8X6JI22_9ARAC|nr:hypothetical protein TNIN_90941 [Trichonephila inaurata madagascariensis]
MFTSSGAQSQTLLFPPFVSEIYCHINSHPRLHWRTLLHEITAKKTAAVLRCLVAQKIIEKSEFPILFQARCIIVLEARGNQHFGMATSISTLTNQISRPNKINREV